jgi:hypothetical protein
LPCLDLWLLCWEAYKVASKYYQKAFSRPRSIRETYFNFKSGAFYLAEKTFQVSLPEVGTALDKCPRPLYFDTITNISKVGALVVRVTPKSSPFPYRPYLITSLFDLLTRFRGVKTLTFAVSYDEVRDQKELKRHQPQ